MHKNGHIKETENILIFQILAEIVQSWSPKKKETKSKCYKLRHWGTSKLVF